MKTAILVALLGASILAAVIWFSWVRPELDRRSDRRRAGRDAAAQWTRYSHPVGESYLDYEVGTEVQLTTGTKRFTVRKWLGRHPDLDERTRAELEADVKAAEFNTTHWRP